MAKKQILFCETQSIFVAFPYCLFELMGVHRRGRGQRGHLPLDFKKKFVFGVFSGFWEPLEMFLSHSGELALPLKNIFPPSENVM